MKKIHLLCSMVIALSMLCFHANAQCAGYNISPDDCQTCVKITLPPAPTLCPGGSFTFTPSVTVPSGFTFQNYVWSGSVVTPSLGTTLPPSTTITPPMLPLPQPCSVVPYSYTLMVNALAPNVVMNPDFSASNTGFCTQYYYNATPSSLITTEYSVCTDASVMPGWGTFPPFYGHTGGGSGPDDMLVAIGDANVNEVWVQTVPVCPGESYEFSFWMATLHTSLGYPSGIHAELYVTIMDATGATIMSGPLTTTSYDLWELKGFSWFNPALPGNTYATIYISGGGPTPGPWSIMPWGTAFAIDDISFNRVCKTVARMNVKVEYPEIKGPSSVCVGSSISMNGCPPGGTWSSTPNATVDAMGNVTGITPGIATITYVSPNGCIATANVTVNALPVISGPPSVCVGSSIMWTSSTGPGIWSFSSHFSYVPTGPSTSATFSGIFPGIGTIIFKDIATGCVTKATVVVEPRPVVQDVHICVGASVAMIAAPPGGTWVSSNLSVATIDPFTGIVTGVSPGSATITYTSPAGCIGTATVFVYACANGGGIVGGVMCQGDLRIFYTAVGIPTGGTWSSSNPAVATVHPVTGLVTAISGGPVTITYTVGGMSWFINISVIPPATAAVTVTCCPYVFHFTSSCSSTAIIEYDIIDYVGNVLATTTTTPGSIAFSTIALMYPTAVKVCIKRVWCNGCWWPVNDCASVNPPSPKTNSIGTTEGAEHSLNVIPNPNKGTFTIVGTFGNMNASGGVKVAIVDMLGKTLFTDVVNTENGMLNKNISLNNNIANGVYYIRIMNAGETATLKFVLDR